MNQPITPSEMRNPPETNPAGFIKTSAINPTKELHANLTNENHSKT